MYGWIWRQLPGPVAVRVFEALALAIGLVALLMFVVFPWLAPLVQFDDVTAGFAVGTAGHWLQGKGPGRD